MIYHYDDPIFDMFADWEAACLNRFAHGWAAFQSFLQAHHNGNVRAWDDCQ